MNKEQKLRERFWETDLQNGGGIFYPYQEIKRVLKDCDMAWVEEQYERLKLHAIKNTKFYHQLSVDDVFPVMNKSKILAHYDEHCAIAGFEGPIHFSSTSGSTGIPFTVVQDGRKRKRHIADLKAMGDLCDYPSHERMVYFRVLDEKLHRTPEQEENENIFYVDSRSLDKDSLEKMKRILVEKKPRIVFSYPSTLVEIARYLIETNTSPSEICANAALVSGESISTDSLAIIAKAFDCKVYRRYADMECGILAQDDGDEGNYHLNYGSYYFECLKIDSDLPADDGEIGRIVITDLFNYALPMIRYDTGDLGVMWHPKDGSFPYFSEIIGRQRDCIYATNGKMLSPAVATVELHSLKDVRQWQFIQKKEKEYLLKLSGTTTLNQSVNNALTKIQRILGQDANICVEYVDEIPVEKSNKRRAVVCEWEKKQ